MDISNLFDGMMPWIAIGIVIVLLFVSETIRNIIRWIVFLPLSFLLALLLNFINFADMIVGLLFSQISYAISIIVDVITVAQDLFFILIFAQLIAPIKRIGAIIASSICLLVEFYNLYSHKVCAIFPFAYEDGLDSIDWTSSGIVLGVSLLIVLIFSSQSDD